MPVVYVSGYCTEPSEGNGDADNQKIKAGIGAFWGPKSRLNTCAPLLFAPATINRADLASANHALQCALNYDMREVIIKTPSEYVMEAYHNLIPFYRKHKFRREDGKAVSNRDLLIQMDNLVSAIVRAGHTVRFQLVHNVDNVKPAIAADNLAKRGSDAYTADF